MQTPVVNGLMAENHRLRVQLGEKMGTTSDADDTAASRSTPSLLEKIVDVTTPSNKGSRDDISNNNQAATPATPSRVDKTAHATGTSTSNISSTSDDTTRKGCAVNHFTATSTAVQREKLELSPTRDDKRSDKDLGVAADVLRSLRGLSRDAGVGGVDHRNCDVSDGDCNNGIGNANANKVREGDGGKAIVGRSARGSGSTPGRKDAVLPAKLREVDEEGAENLLVAHSLLLLSSRVMPTSAGRLVGSPKNPPMRFDGASRAMESPPRPLPGSGKTRRRRLSEKNASPAAAAAAAAAAAQAPTPRPSRRSPLVPRTTNVREPLAGGVVTPKRAVHGTAAEFKENASVTAVPR